LLRVHHPGGPCESLGRAEARDEKCRRSCMGPHLCQNRKGGPATGTDYGIHVDIRYQVQDQNKAAIASSTMIPQESVNNSGYMNIGPNIDMTTQFTAADGTYHDAPVGICATTSFSQAVVTQLVRMGVAGSFYNVRTNSFTANGPSSGHGSITNGSDINATR
jgi:hypothetical protein